MNTRLAVIIYAFLFPLLSFSQKKQELAKIFSITAIAVKNPIMTDTININSKKFEEKDLLDLQVNVPEQTNFTKEIYTNTSNYFPADRPDKDFYFHLFSFYVNTSQYTKGSLKIVSPNMLEVYVDGKKEATKTTKEDSMSEAKDVKTELIAYPNTKRVVIKLLTSAEDKRQGGLKISIEQDEKGSSANFNVLNTNKRHFEFNDVLTGKRVSSAKISPNGLYALISYKNSFGEKSQTTTELYSIKTNKKILLDVDNAKKQLNWMPSSEKLYYVNKEGNICNLVLIDPITLEEKEWVKNIPDENIYVSPDENALFYTKKEEGKKPKNDLKRLLAPEDRQDGFRNRYFIYKYDIGTGLNQRLTYGMNTTQINDISSDSKFLLFSVRKNTINEWPFSKTSLYKVDLTNLAVDTLWANEAFAYNASFSPDGRHILIQGAAGAFSGIGLNIDKGQIPNSYDNQSFIMDLATKKIEAITKNFDPSVNNCVWSKIDNMIYLTVTDRDYVNVYCYNPSNKKFTLLPLQEDVIRSFSVSDNSLVAIYTGVGLTNTTRSYLFDIKGLKSVLIADPYKEQLSKIEFGNIEDWNFTNSAGMKIEGRYYLPPSFDRSKKYPMIVYYYGGTSPTARSYEHNYPPHMYAALGYVVYVVQPSGAIGYGQKFSALHVNAWGKRTAEDIIEGTESFIKEHPFVNEKKIGCIGASYGGFMTMYLQTKTEMFSAAVSHAGISALSSYWGEGYWGYTYSAGASAHSYPWNNWDLYVKQSPLFNADKIKTPILLLHGASDTNVPPGESIQMYTALKILGKEVEFIEVKDENHVIAKYQNRLDWMNSIMAWFDKWLKDEPEWWDSLYK